MLCGETAIVTSADTPAEAYKKCRAALCVIDMRKAPITITIEDYLNIGKKELSTGVKKEQSTKHKIVI